MDEVKAWLVSVGLGEYCANFEENGWDEMAILPEMVDCDIEACIPKAGHRAKFKKALQLTHQDEKSRIIIKENSLRPVYKYDKVLLNGDAVNFEGATSLMSGGYPRSLTAVAGQNTKETMTASSAQRPRCSKEVIKNTDDYLREPHNERTDDSMSALELAEKQTSKLEESEESAYIEQHLRPLAVGTELTSDLTDVPVNLTIIEHSEHTTIAESSSQMSSNIVDNLKDHMETIANSFRLKDHLFVETRLFLELKTAVEEMNWVTLLGKPGDGKSTTAAHLMLQYAAKGFKPLLISSPQDWKTLISSCLSEKQFVVINDMFGISYVNSKLVDEWLAEISNMERVVEAKGGNLKILSTSRKYIFNDVRSALVKFPCFGKMCIVDMTDDDIELSGDEKLAIFTTFSEEYSIELNSVSLKDIPSLNPPHGFPHCVELFCTNAFLRQTVCPSSTIPGNVYKKKYTILRIMIV